MHLNTRIHEFKQVARSTAAVHSILNVNSTPSSDTIIKPSTVSNGKNAIRLRFMVVAAVSVAGTTASAKIWRYDDRETSGTGSISIAKAPSLICDLALVGGSTVVTDLPRGVIDDDRDYAYVDEITITNQASDTNVKKRGIDGGEFPVDVWFDTEGACGILIDMITDTAEDVICLAKWF